MIKSTEVKGKIVIRSRDIPEQELKLLLQLAIHRINKGLSARTAVHIVL